MLNIDVKLIQQASNCVVGCIGLEILADLPNIHQAEISHTRFQVIGLCQNWRSYIRLLAQDLHNTIRRF
jgi:hypothetical protein